MYLVRGVWGTGDRSLRIAVGAERDTVGHGTRRTTWPVVSTGRFLWADGVGALPSSYGRDARECRLDLYPARQRGNTLRTSRLGPSSDSARCRWTTDLRHHGIHARPPVRSSRKAATS